MRFREFLQKILFKFFYIKNEKLKQFFISIFFLMMISFIVLTIILIKQNSENNIKKNILEAVSGSRNTGEAEQDTDENKQDIAQGKDENAVFAIQGNNMLIVYICGEIKNPGVYEVVNGSRINDLIKAAGGTSEKACIELINPAQKLIDGQKIYIPSDEERSEFVLSVNEENTESYENQVMGVININFASGKELEALPGIGSELASRIVQYRETHGGFESIEALKKVSGIGEKKFNDIKEMITV